MTAAKLAPDTVYTVFANEKPSIQDPYRWKSDLRYIQYILVYTDTPYIWVEPSLTESTDKIQWHRAHSQDSEGICIRYVLPKRTVNVIIKQNC